MALATKRVAVIGAGPAGLTAAKSMLDAGLHPIVFDKSKGVGGMWNADYHPAWANLRTNISRYTMTFSDLPWTRVMPAPIPDHVTQAQMQRYLETYAEVFLPPQHFALETTVHNVSPASDNTPGWQVTWSSEAAHKAEVFDHVVVATGFFNTPRAPTLAGLDSFTGTVMHSTDFRTAEPLRGKRVVILGAAHSACEIASEIAGVAARIDHVITKPFWATSRLLPFPPGSPAPAFAPLDVLMLRRHVRKTPHEVLPSPLTNLPTNTAITAMLGDQAHTISPLLHVDPNTPPYFALSEYFAMHVRGGRINLHKGRAVSVEGPTVVLDTGVRLPDADVLILATGFNPSLPFFSQELLSEIEYDPEDLLQPLLLHRTVFHPKLPGMAFVGMYRGPQQPVMEIQGKWAAAVFSGQAPHPTESEMYEGIDKERLTRKLNPKPQFPHFDAVGLYDDIARAAGLPAPAGTITRGSADDYFLTAYHGPAGAHDAAVSEMSALMAAAQGGHMVARFVFNSLEGTWKFTRRIDSRRTDSPSGTVQGKATFTYLPPPPPSPTTTTHADPPAARRTHQLLYREEGVFTLDTGGTMKATREYIWEYDTETDTLSVHFVKNGQKDYEFHGIRVTPPAHAAGDSTAANGAAAAPAAGWRAVGEQHLCGEDTYDTNYLFVFKNVLVDRFEIRYDVVGPRKDYTSVAGYTRQGGVVLAPGEGGEGEAKSAPASAAANAEP